MKARLRTGFYRLRRIEPFVFLVIVGIAYLSLAGAPANYAWVNACALAAALLAILFLRPIHQPRWRSALVVVAVTLLALPLLVGPNVMDVQRWLTIGPVTIHIGMVTLPVLCILLPQLDDRIAALAVVCVALILALQPDAGTGIAWAFAALTIAAQAQSLWLGAGFLFAASAWAHSALEMVSSTESLPAVAYVEGVFGDLFQNDILWFIPAATMALWLCFRVTTIAQHNAEGHALEQLTYGLFLAAVWSNFPTPLLGYGAAPIIGYGLAFGLMEMKRPQGGYNNENIDADQ